MSQDWIHETWENAGRVCIACIKSLWSVGTPAGTNTTYHVFGIKIREWEFSAVVRTLFLWLSGASDIPSLVSTFSANRNSLNQYDNSFPSTIHDSQKQTGSRWEVLSYNVPIIYILDYIHLHLDKTPRGERSENRGYI